MEKQAPLAQKVSSSVSKTQLPKAKKKKTHIFVNTHVHQTPSQHVIDLGKEQPKSWQQVSVYKEKCYLPPKRVSVNFAQHIEKHKAKQQAQDVKKVQAPDFLEGFTPIEENQAEPVTEQQTASTAKPLDHLFAAKEVDILAKYRNIDKPIPVKPALTLEQLAKLTPPTISKKKVEPVAAKPIPVVPSQPEVALQKQDQPVVFNLFTGMFQKKALAFALAMLAVLPFPVMGYVKEVKDHSAVVIEETKNAFMSLQASTVAAFNADAQKAEHDLETALEAFKRAEDVLEKEHGTLLFVSRMLPVVGEQIEGRQAVLQAGHHVALGNKYLVEAIGDIQGDSQFSLSDKLVIMRSSLRSSIVQYQAALDKLSTVDQSVVPAEYQQTFHEFKLLFATLVNDLSDLEELSDVMVTAFGHEEFRRYIIVFQNQHEIRPTGGFMGSFAVVDVQKGKLLSVDVPGGGTYDVQGQLEEVLEPPLPLQLINTRWEFQDANWFPDFPTSAQKIDWFYRQTRKQSSDGVIAINASVLEKILGVIGPFQHDSLGKLDKDNVIVALQKEVEIDYDKEENKPKAAIGEMLEGLLEQMNTLDASQGLALLAEIHGALSEKEIQVAFQDKQMHKTVEQFGWTGNMASTQQKQDYLMVVHSNIGGAKSDARINTQVKHEARILPDGSIEATVRIHKKHKGKTGEIFYGDDNIDYLRIYVPKGAVLTDAGGFVFPDDEDFQVPEEGAYTDTFLTGIEQNETVHIASGTRVTEEFGKTTFANWMVTRAGDESEVYFTYTLPFKLEQTFVPKTNFQKWRDDFVGKVSDQAMRYSLLVQKQSGVTPEYSFEVSYPEGYMPEWMNVDEARDGLDAVSYQELLKDDLLFGVVFRRDV